MRKYCVIEVSTFEPKTPKVLVISKNKDYAFTFMNHRIWELTHIENPLEINPEKKDSAHIVIKNEKGRETGEVYLYIRGSEEIK